VSASEKPEPPPRRWAVDRQQVLILMAAAVMLGSFGLFVLWPKHRELASLEGALEQERRLLGRRVAASREGLYVSARIPVLRRNQEALLRWLPDGPEVAEFLRAVEASLAEVGDVRHEVLRTGEPTTAAETWAVPLTLRLEGPFPAVYRALAALEGVHRLHRLARLRVARAEDQAGGVVAEVDLLAYFLPEGETSATPEAASAETDEGERPPAPGKDETL